MTRLAILVDRTWTLRRTLDCARAMGVPSALVAAMVPPDIPLDELTYSDDLTDDDLTAALQAQFDAGQPIAAIRSAVAMAGIQVFEAEADA